MRQSTSALGLMWTVDITLRPFSYIFTWKFYVQFSAKKIRGFRFAHPERRVSLAKCKSHQRRNLDDMVSRARGHAPARFRDSFTDKQRA